MIDIIPPIILDVSSASNTPPYQRMSGRPSFRRAGNQAAGSGESVQYGDVAAALQSALGNVGLPGIQVPNDPEANQAAPTEVNQTIAATVAEVNQVAATPSPERRIVESVPVNLKSNSRASSGATDSNAPQSKRARVRSS